NTFTAADQGVLTFSATLKTAGGQAITAADAAAAGGSGTQTGIMVRPAAANRFSVAGFPSPVTAGAAGTLTVTAWDPYGNRATGYRGPIAFRSPDPTAPLPRNYTFTAADQGVHTFNGLVLKKRGNQTVAVTDTLTSSLAVSVSIDVR